MADKPDSFAKKVQSYHQSIREEFDAVASGDVEAVVERCKLKILSNLVTFTNELVDLASNADSETVRLNAIKTGFDLVGGKDADKTPIADLLRELSKSTETS